MFQALKLVFLVFLMSSPTSGHVTVAKLDKGISIKRDGVVVTDIGQMNPLVSIKIPKARQVLKPLLDELRMENQIEIKKQIEALIQYSDMKIDTLFDRLIDQLQPIGSERNWPPQQGLVSSGIKNMTLETNQRNKRFVTLAIIAGIGLASALGLGITGAVLGSQAASRAKDLEEKIKIITDKQNDIIKSLNSMTEDIKILHTVSKELVVTVNKLSDTQNKIMGEVTKLRKSEIVTSYIMSQVAYILATDYSSLEQSISMLLMGKLSLHLMNRKEFASILNLHTVNEESVGLLTYADLIYSLTSVKLIAVDKEDSILSFMMTSPVLDSSHVYPLYRVMNTGFPCKQGKCKFQTPDHIIPINTRHPVESPLVYPNLDHCKDRNGIWICGSAVMNKRMGTDYCWYPYKHCVAQSVEDEDSFLPVDGGWAVYISKPTDAWVDPPTGSNYALQLDQGSYFINCSQGENLQIRDSNLLTQKQVSWIDDEEKGSIKSLSDWIRNQGSINPFNFTENKIDEHALQILDQIQEKYNIPLETSNGFFSTAHQFTYSDLSFVILFAIVLLAFVTLVYWFRRTQRGKENFIMVRRPARPEAEQIV